MLTSVSSGCTHTSVQRFKPFLKKLKVHQTELSGSSLIGQKFLHLQSKQRIFSKNDMDYCSRWLGPTEASFQLTVNILDSAGDDMKWQRTLKQTKSREELCQWLQDVWKCSLVVTRTDAVLIDYSWRNSVILAQLRAVHLLTTSQSQYMPDIAYRE